MAEEGEVVPVSSTGEKYHYHVDDRYGSDEADGRDWQTPFQTMAAAQRDITIYSRVSCRTYAYPCRAEHHRTGFLPWKLQAHLVAYPRQTRRPVRPPSGLPPSLISTGVLTPTGFEELD